MSCHDVSDGGVLVAAAEMCIASGLGLSLDGLQPDQAFVTGNAMYLIEVHAQGVDQVAQLMKAHGVSFSRLGRVNPDSRLEMWRPTSARSQKFDLHVGIDELTRAWRGTLDW